MQPMPHTGVPVGCTKAPRLSHGHLILQLVEVVHGSLLRRHVPSMQECLGLKKHNKMKENVTAQREGFTGQGSEHWPTQPCDTPSMIALPV